MVKVTSFPTHSFRSEYSDNTWKVLLLWNSLFESCYHSPWHSYKTSLKRAERLKGKNQTKLSRSWPCSSNELLQILMLWTEHVPRLGYHANIYVLLPTKPHKKFNMRKTSRNWIVAWGECKHEPKWTTAGIRCHSWFQIAGKNVDKIHSKCVWE